VMQGASIALLWGKVRIVHGILQSLQQGQHMLLDRRRHGTLLGGQRAAQHALWLISGMFLLLAMRTRWICDGWRVGCVGGGRFSLAFICVPRIWRHLVVAPNPGPVCCGASASPSFVNQKARRVLVGVSFWRLISLGLANRRIENTENDSRKGSDTDRACLKSLV
jgi:hypothetical protein